jgi:hypothetical protein
MMKLKKSQKPQDNHNQPKFKEDTSRIQIYTNPLSNVYATSQKL